jgi:uncharacterized membrane-anchored protein YjiN (DUF445 family)
MNLNYSTYKEQLFEVLLSKNPEEQLTSFANKFTHQEIKRKLIYNLFIEFHQDIQQDYRTKNNEHLYDILSDFMDTLVD